MSRRKDETGNVYGRLTVISYGGTEVKPSGQKFSTWICLCECGEQTTVAASALRQGATQSCGCFHKERSIESNTTHGDAGKTAYNAWCSMRARCLIPTSSGYSDYGGRGITICDRWVDEKDGYLNFLGDMGEPPKSTSLDRINNDGNYYPENCRWADKSTQNFNRHKLKRNTSGRTGVTYVKSRDRWRAEILLNYKRIYLGQFLHKEDAILARESAELKYRGVIKE